ncbi:unnamed protein product [Didymodactylos carnosus]|uniref:Uncharacterized protein n=1 Tax=Didymodactylos carnosus TaxID=1234261 RepID=A0A815Q077_9BILA|nr:unnamed protein product [Didymodactylos carnosus]CAF1455681.1 unnamed protein product [Didymodactylos carnosus]CAF3575262.1 unnamed protein product [Didymodactylos carnosus]CAF4327577.1 unnamed protein product [Didymodactylos carnosus]
MSVRALKSKAKRGLRHNPCVAYFLSSSIADVFELYSGLLVRCLNGFGVDPTLLHPVACKIRFFIVAVADVAHLWFLVLTVTICILPISLSKLYQTLTISITTKSPMRLAIEGFIFQFTIIVSYTNNSIVFFIYTLSGKIFRQELLRVLERQSIITPSMQKTTTTRMRIQHIQ